MFSIKETANNLGYTPQAIYKQKEELLHKGYMKKSDTGEWEISIEGFNYLQDKKAKQIQQQSVGLKEVESKSIDNTGHNHYYGLNETLINSYETRIEELKESYEKQLSEQKQQVEYFKDLYEQEKSERIKANAQYQTYLLGTAEDNKKSWFSRLFQSKKVVEQ